MLDVIQIIFLLNRIFGDCSGITIIDLSPTGDTWFDQQASPVEGDFLLVFFNQFGPFGAWPDDAHFTAQDVPGLRQFVNMGSTQEAAGSRDARIILFGWTGQAVLFSILAHCAELVEGIWLAAFAGPDLLINDGRPTVQQNGGGYEWIKNKVNHQTCLRNKNVQQPLGYFVKTIYTGFIHERPDQPFGFEVMNGNAPQ